MQLRSRIRSVGETTVVELDGEADLASIPHLAQVLARVVADAPSADIVVDLDALTLLDDAALGQLVGAAAAVRRRGGELRLLATGERLRHRLDETRIDRIVEVVDSLTGPHG